MIKHAAKKEEEFPTWWDHAVSTGSKWKQGQCILLLLPTLEERPSAVSRGTEARSQNSKQYAGWYAIQGNLLGLVMT